MSRKLLVKDGIIHNIIEAGDDFVVKGFDVIDGNGVKADIGWAVVNEKPVEPSVEAIPVTSRELKYQGVDFQGVMCSATKEDMWSLNSIKDWVAAGNNVDFEFDNGNVLTLTKDNYAAFEAVWIPFRAGFF